MRENEVKGGGQGGAGGWGGGDAGEITHNTVHMVRAPGAPFLCARCQKMAVLSLPLSSFYKSV